MADRKRVEALRHQMHEADLEVLKVLERRAKLARQVGELSRQTAVPVIRDQERLQQLEHLASGDLTAEAVHAVFKAIFAVSASLEGPVKVAFVGPEGSIAHVAARSIFGPMVDAVAHETAAQAVDVLGRGRVDYGIAPWETSTDGPVLSTILALKPTDLMVIGQCELAGSISLMSRTGNLADIEKVYGSAHDRAHCQGFLAAKLPRVSVIDVRTPAIACQFAAEDHGGAAIGHETTGEQHGLSVVLANIGDDPDLRIRYAVIGSRPSPRTGQDVTSLIFTVNDEPGALLAVLNHFAKRSINLRNIISRPVPGEIWDYIFYVDIDGHATDRGIVSALDEIKQNTKFVKVLGSFPARC